MIINKEQLIQLLVEKSSLGREQVEDQLSQLIRRIQQAAEEGKSFEIEGFGSFEMQDGVLQYTPADQLQTEINNKYAGMKPIELIGAFKEPEGDEIPDVIETPADLSELSWSFDEEAADKADEKPEPEVEEKVPDSEEIEEMPEPVEEEAQEEFEELLNEADTAAEEPRETEPEKEVVDETEEDKEESSDPIGRWVAAAIVVIVLGAGSFLLYDLGVFDSATNESLANVSQSIESTSPNVDDTQPANKPAEDSETSSEPEEENEVVKNDRSDEQGGESSSPYGLEGKFNPSVDNGYMIVVYSLRNLEKAKANKQELVEEGYRASINRATVQGVTYYRVGIGQFSSVKDAQNAVSRIPEPYRSDNFIKRIQ